MQEAIKESIQNLRTNKLRSLLTMFGIMWGVISIVILSALGEGFQRGNQAVLEELGKKMERCEELSGSCLLEATRDFHTASDKGSKSEIRIKDDALHAPSSSGGRKRRRFSIHHRPLISSASVSAWASVMRLEAAISASDRGASLCRARSCAVLSSRNQAMKAANARSSTAFREIVTWNSWSVASTVIMAGNIIRC